ncbi:MAG: DUF1622 domain-containing protein [Fibrobacter sp.]|nr:DUF1622 domain-containing protein [Fibrobacter sp.]
MQHIALVGRFLEVLGIGIVLLGALYSTFAAIRNWKKQKISSVVFNTYREQFGKSILLGLEFMVGGDIINTVATIPTLENVAVLGAIVLIRTFLSFTLEVEMTGRWPWGKGNRDKL